jgi:hypothetical protein
MAANKMSKTKEHFRSSRVGYRLHQGGEMNYLRMSKRIRVHGIVTHRPMTTTATMHTLLKPTNHQTRFHLHPDSCRNLLILNLEYVPRHPLLFLPNAKMRDAWNRSQPNPLQKKEIFRLWISIRMTL